jgi:hypothetical protein
MDQPLVVLERAVRAHDLLNAAGIPCAIGGALSLGYHVADPRSTQDIDLNIAVDKTRVRDVFEHLPMDVPWTDEHRATVDRDGQVRIMWPVEGDPVPIPLDLFFAEHEFHRQAVARAIAVPMLDAQVRILTATDLVVFKALYDRGKDWVDIQYVVDYDPPSFRQAEAVDWVGRIVGFDDPRTKRLAKMRPEEQREFRFPAPPAEDA